MAAGVPRNGESLYSVRNSEGRLPALDGIRGLAALAVLFWHSFLIASPYLVVSARLGGTDLGGLYWWITATPLKLFTSGVEAVIVFFLLSGFVVALPAMESTNFRWREYYPRRLVRLYFPVVASVVLAAGLVFLANRSGAPAGSWQTTMNAKSVNPLQILWEATLIQESQLNNPLWSLRWEVLFSLLLPLYWLIAMRTRRLWLFAILGCLLLSQIGYETNFPPLMYLPMFLVGTISAANHSRIASFAANINRRKSASLYWAIIVLISILFLIGAHLLPDDSGALGQIGRVLSRLPLVGAMGMIFAAMGSRHVAGFLLSSVPQWLGKISFSLYLVHVPILVTLAFLFGNDFWPAAIGVGIPSAIFLAVLFARWVERPSHRFSKRVGRFARGSDSSDQAILRGKASET